MADLQKQKLQLKTLQKKGSRRKHLGGQPRSQCRCQLPRPLQRQRCCRSQRPRRPAVSLPRHLRLVVRRPVASRDAPEPLRRACCALAQPQNCAARADPAASGHAAGLLLPSAPAVDVCVVALLLLVNRLGTPWRRLPTKCSGSLPRQAALRQGLW